MDENGGDPRATNDADSPDSESATDPLADADVYRVLGPDGSPLPDATVPELSDEAFRAIYRDLVTARSSNRRVVTRSR